MKRLLNDSKKKARKRILIETLMVFLIVISPFIFKMHEYVSSDPDATLNFFGILIDKNGFPNINVYVWFLLGKLVPLYLLLIWFFTCKHWWYHIILIPLLMYAFQIFEGVFSEDQYIDTDNIMWLLPFCMIVVPFVYFIRIKLYDKYVHGIDLEAMEAELKALKEKQGITTTPVSDDSEKNDIVEPTEEPLGNGYQTLTEKIDEKLSTHNLESMFKQFQRNLQNWLHLRF